MNIGSYTFQEFKRLAENFHGYAAPGLLIGGYMVEMAKARIPEGTLFEAVVETRKCLPDAVQLLTLCSAGNNWMKVHNLGRYAVSLFDKHTGEGVRVSVDRQADLSGTGAGSQGKAKRIRMRSAAQEIEEAGDGICREPALRAASSGTRISLHTAPCAASVPQRGRAGLQAVELCHGQPGTEAR
ncbi:MAG: FmdE family protein [Bilophila wadsworthia]